MYIYILYIRMFDTYPYLFLFTFTYYISTHNYRNIYIYVYYITDMYTYVCIYITGKLTVFSPGVGSRCKGPGSRQNSPSRVMGLSNGACMGYNYICNMITMKYY